MFPLPSQRVLRVLLPFVSFSLALWLTISYINPSSPSFAPSSPFTSRAIPFHAHPQSQLQSRQAPNTWYSKDPLGQTASYNFTAFVLPLKKEVAAGLVGGTERDLLPLPVKELGLEGVVGEGEHALVCMSGLLFDIRQAVLSIERLQVSIREHRVQQRRRVWCTSTCLLTSSLRCASCPCSCSPPTATSPTTTRRTTAARPTPST